MHLQIDSRVRTFTLIQLGSSISFNLTCMHDYDAILSICRIRVDGRAIRAFKNYEQYGVPFPTWQQQRLYGSLWDADEWATQGGRIKTDWSEAPFVAYYRNYNFTWCQPSPGVSWCGAEPKDSKRFDLDQKTRGELWWASQYMMIYDYCTDHRRFNESDFPKECALQRQGL